MALADIALSSNEVAVRVAPDKRLIRAGLLMLLFMTCAFGAATWNAVQDLSNQIRAIPVVLFVVVCILVALLYVKADEIARVPEAFSCGETKLAQIPLDKIWKYWDKNGTGRQGIEYVRSTYSVPAAVVQYLLEHYDAGWREQVALLYSDHPVNEYTAYTGIDTKQLTADALRLKSGLPIYPLAGVWLCSDCRQRPCHCD